MGVRTCRLGSSIVGVLAATVGAAVAGPSALAADPPTVVSVAGLPGTGIVDPGLLIQGAATGADLRLTVNTDGSQLRVTPVDRASGSINPVAPCVKILSTGAASCPTARMGTVLAVMGGADDRVDASAVSSLQVILRGGGGNDTLVGGPVALAFASGSLRSVTRLEGQEGNDILRAAAAGTSRTELQGGNGNDQLLGGPGVDVLEGGAGGDLIDGGGGADFTSYADSALLSQRQQPVTVTLGDALCNDGGTIDQAPTNVAAVPGCSANGVDRDLIRNTESVTGGGGADDLTGGPGAGVINGFPGADRIEGGPAADTLLGTNGNDTLFARDSLADVLVECTRSFDFTGAPGTRAVVDELDPVENCITVERGGPGTAGPIGVPTPIPPPPAIGEPIATPETPPLIPATPVEPSVPATEPPGATGAGGGDDGKTPPQLQIISPGATLDKSGRIGLRVRCVYKAKACAGTITVKARAAATARRKGKKARLRKGQSLGSAGVSIPWGVSKATPVKLNRAASTFLKTSRKPLTVTVTVRARDSAFPTGAVATVTASVRIAARR